MLLSPSMYVLEYCSLRQKESFLIFQLTRPPLICLSLQYHPALPNTRSDTYGAASLEKLVTDLEDFRMLLFETDGLALASKAHGIVWTTGSN